MDYDYNDKKIIVVLSSTIDSSIALNVMGHLSVSLGAYIDTKNLMGQKKIYDKNKNEHVGISKYPIITTKLKSSKLKKFIHNIKEKHKDIFIVDYPSEMLDTKSDNELIKVMQIKDSKDIVYYGALIFGDTKIISELTGKFSLWK